MVYDYTILKSKIEEKFGSQEKFAEAMGILPSSLSMKLSNSVEFSQPQIAKAIELLKLNSKKEIDDCFFTHKVQK